MLEYSHLPRRMDHIKIWQDAWMEESRALDAYVQWHRRRGAAPSLDEIMNLPSTNDHWAKESSVGGEEGAFVKSTMVTVVLNVFEKKVSCKNTAEAEGRWSGGLMKEVATRKKLSRTALWIVFIE